MVVRGRAVITLKMMACARWVECRLLTPTVPTRAPPLGPLRAPDVKYNHPDGEQDRRGCSDDDKPCQPRSIRYAIQAHPRTGQYRHGGKCPE